MSQTGLALGWNASSDNVAVTGYDVYRNGAKVASARRRARARPASTCGTSYAFAVVARDAAGNSSQQAQLTVSTAACSTTLPPGDTRSAVDARPVSPPRTCRRRVSTLSWNASSDNVAVTGYDVYRNGAKVASAAPTSVEPVRLLLRHLVRVRRRRARRRRQLLPSRPS